MGHSSFYFGNRFLLLGHWLMLGGQITLIAPSAVLRSVFGLLLL
jgi:hypothetical protein